MALHHCGNPSCLFEDLEQIYVDLYNSGEISENQLLIIISEKNFEKQQQKAKEEKEKNEKKELERLEKEYINNGIRILENIIKDGSDILPIEIFTNTDYYNEIARDLSDLYKSYSNSN